MLTPKQIVAELDKYVIGQKEAKKAVAIAIRNRWRRQKLPRELREEVSPRNIIMIGPTGVGKTEIARRLARLSDAPFIKVEASKFTEVGYVGRDVESMIRDLTEIAVNMVKAEKTEEVHEKAAALAEERVLDLLLPKRPAPSAAGAAEEQADRPNTREKLREKLRRGELDQRQVEIEVREKPFQQTEMFAGTGMEELGVDFQDFLNKMLPEKTKTNSASVPEALRLLSQEETYNLIDMEQAIKTAVEKTENSGIIFLDEIDKIAGREGRSGPDVSREGVQRDILPVVEGTSVATKYGIVRTDHILFIAAGAFHVSKPSDLIPELQGRFPIRVELLSLEAEDFEKILMFPQNALTKQYKALMKTENIQLRFSDDAVREIANMAFAVNQQTQDIGARRLHTVMEKLLEEISFEVPARKKNITIDAAYVKQALTKIIADTDVSRYIL